MVFKFLKMFIIYKYIIILKDSNNIEKVKNQSQFPISLVCISKKYRNTQFVNLVLFLSKWHILFCTLLFSLDHVWKSFMKQYGTNLFASVLLLINPQAVPAYSLQQTAGWTFLYLSPCAYVQELSLRWK